MTSRSTASDPPPAGHYAPLRDYALIGDGHTAALVSNEGSIDWYCPSRFDAPAALCRLLDARHGGYFHVSPVETSHVSRGYLGSSNVLSTDFVTPRGRLRLTDFMPLRWDGLPKGTARILRRIECLQGVVDVRVDFVPTFDFGRVPASAWADGRVGGARGEGHALWLSCPFPLRAVEGGLYARGTLRAGETRWLALSEEELGWIDEEREREATQLLELTQYQWESWVDAGEYPEPYRPLLQRSALLLKLLTYAPTGAIVAAPTSSLPEVLGGVRNWDYRYCWLRDSAWIVGALMGLGYHEESMDFIGWLENLHVQGQAPSTLYTVDGHSPCGEEVLAHLEGYHGSSPVRVGNGPATQAQHDIFGEVVAALFICSEGMPSMRPLRPSRWRLIGTLADSAAERWPLPDQGMWEVREAPRHFFSSKLMCWVALDRAVRISERDGLPDARVSTWKRERAAVCRALLEQGLDTRTGAFSGVLGSHQIDASVLLVPRVGFLPASDPRVRASVARIQQGLDDNGFVRRYAEDDGLPGHEGVFLSCNFWLADALAMDDRLEEAKAVFERAAGMANDVGLLSEEADAQSRMLLGNFPQGFTHLTLIRAALSIAEAEERRDATPCSAPPSRP